MDNDVWISVNAHHLPSEVQSEISRVIQVALNKRFLNPDFIDDEVAGSCTRCGSVVMNHPSIQGEYVSSCKCSDSSLPNVH
jgi:hypothetical protein